MNHGSWTPGAGSRPRRPAHQMALYLPIEGVVDVGTSLIAGTEIVFTPELGEVGLEEWGPDVEAWPIRASLYFERLDPTYKGEIGAAEAPPNEPASSSILDRRIYVGYARLTLTVPAKPLR